MRWLLGALIKIQAPLRFAVHTQRIKGSACPLQPRDRAGRDEQANGDKGKAVLKYKHSGAFAALYIRD